MIALSLLSSLMLLGQVDTTKDILKYKLNEIVVTTSRYPKHLKDIPIITRVISSEEIKRTSSQSLVSLLESEVPGLEFSQTEGVTNNITFQGLGANYILFLVDGERLAGETSRSNPDFNRVNLDNIERIEIIKGSMSTLYGSGAVAGVINIITKNEKKPLFSTIGANVNGNGESKYNLSFGGCVKKISTGTYVSFRSKEAFFLPNNTVTPSIFEVEGFKNISFEEKIKYDVSKKLNFSLKGGFYNHERYNAGDVGKIMHDIYKDWNVNFKSEYKQQNKNLLEVSFNLDNYTKYIHYFKLGSTEKNYRNILYNPRLLYVINTFENHNITTGIELLAENLSTYQFTEGEDNSVVSSATYIQDDYKVTKFFNIQTGIRIDYHSVYHFNINPKIALMAKSGEFTFRLGYASGYRSPSLKELYTNWSHQGFFQLMGNKNLKPEKSYNFSSSVEYTKRKYNASVNIYHNIITNKISTIWNPSQDTTYYSNIARASVTGLDFNFRFDITKDIALRGAYSFVKDWQSIDGLNTSSVRPHTAVIKLDYNFKYKKVDFSLGLNGRYMSGIELFSFNQTLNKYEQVNYPDYSIWQLSFMSSLPKGVTIKCGVDNLFNYKPSLISFNSVITKGTTLFFSINVNIESLLKKRIHS